MIVSILAILAIVIFTGSKEIEKCFIGICGLHF